MLLTRAWDSCLSGYACLISVTEEISLSWIWTEKHPLFWQRQVSCRCKCTFFPRFQGVDIEKGNVELSDPYCYKRHPILRFS